MLRHNNQMTRCRFIAPMIAFAAFVVPVSAQNTYTWTGQNTNNWDANANWTGASGWPDAPSDNVRFDANANRFSVDLRGGDRDVGNVQFASIGNNDYTFESNTGGAGILRINGNVSANSGMSPSDATVTFTNEIDVYQVTNGTWSLGNVDFFMDANLDGSGEIELFTGVLQLNASNPYSGNLRIRPLGGVNLGHVNALANALVTLEQQNTLRLMGLNASIGALAGTGQLNLGTQTVTFGNRNTPSTYSGVLVGTGNIVKIGSAVWTLDGDNTFTGTVTVNGGAISLGSSTTLASNTIIVNTINGLRVNGEGRLIGGLGGGGHVTLDNTLRIGNNNSNVTYSGSMDGTGTIRKIGTGTQIFSGTCAYTGGTFLDGGVLSVRGNNNLGNGGGLTFNGGQLTTTDSFTLTQNIDFNDSSIVGTINVVGGETVQVTGTIDSDPNNALMKVGAGNLRLNSANPDFLGTLIIPQGTVQIGASDALMNAIAEIDVDNGLDLMTVGVNATVGALAGDGALNIGGQTLSISNGLGKNFFGVITGSGAVVKSGNGKQSLSGASLFSGGVTIDGGTLLLTNSTGSATGTGGVVVNSGTLGGTGAANGLTQVNSGGMVAPGMSVGRLVLEQTAFGSGAVLQVELAGNGGSPGTDFDQLIVSGGATINSGAVLELTYPGAFTAAPGDSFEILLAGTLVGEFGTINFPDGQNWIADYDTLNGTLTVGVCIDDDSDGVCNGDDLCPGFDDNVDTDNDGVADGCDVCPGGDDLMDGDGDGTPDFCDPCPLDNPDDSDADSVCDSDDVCPGFDDMTDADNDSVPDGCDTCPGGDDSQDDDNDGVPDFCDVCPGFDDNIDANSNGIPDGCDTGPVHNITLGIHYQEIQVAINAAANGHEIEVDPGTYAEIIDLSGKAITLRSTSGAALTTIDATSVAALPDGKPVVRCDNGEGPDTVLEGFTITGGTGDTALYEGGLGGGLYCDGSSPTLRNCIFRDMTVSFGMGAYVHQGNPAFDGCQFLNNIGTGSSGGSALYVLDAGATISGCSFVDNSSDFGGGGVDIDDATHTVTITDSYFDHNFSDYAGGAVSGVTDNLLIDRCVFHNNSSSQYGGGAVYASRNVSVTNSVFHSNSTMGISGGGALFISDIGAPPVNIANCAFWNNSSATTGGAIKVFGRQGVEIVNCSFAANTSPGGSAIHLESNDVIGIDNCILWGNTGSLPLELQDNGPETVNFSIIEGGWSGAGIGNFDADPLFVDPDGADDIPGNEDDDYRLNAGSPCIDAADYDAFVTSGGGATDLGGDPRTVDLCVADTGTGSLTYLDMGAYERQDDGPDADSDGVPDMCDTCPGFDDNSDVDSDGTPDGCDACPNRAPSDVSGDGMTTVDDIAFFAAALIDPDSATPDEFCAADVNEDSVLNGHDIRAMIDAILSP